MARIFTTPVNFQGKNNSKTFNVLIGDLRQFLAIEIKFSDGAVSNMICFELWV